MFRVFILFGFGFYLMQLHISGDISKYINMKYAYLSFSAMIAAFLLAIIQLIMVFRDEDIGAKTEHMGHTHDGENTILKKIMVYGLLSYALIAGFLFPV
ncbi:DUF1980 domain-containing protein, partial [Listeria monocytogenes]|nr:DUF1980 domain-containing protein [Listeria monocytogenes]EAF3388364.1 DUF1980 domain-containing protein [Listeria monocytogenes]EAG2610883.1 DUF1980 domain-containing protein [Listeria monocytogenes]EAG8840256.1 DUF1980 domain-containing protein [Listeria monocytogenes]EKY8307248.1 DUF1980 domain-containing protein [Listeria monocytogenes]